MSDLRASSVKPPVLQIGILRWLAENLFNTWYNSILTLLALTLLYVVLSSLLGWALSQARWEVIPANIKTLFTGTYPQDQMWRIWTGLYVIGFLLGLSSGIHTGLIRQVASVVAILALALSLVSGLWTLAIVGALLAGFGVGTLAKGVPWTRKLEQTLWLISFPVVLIVMIGMGPQESLLPIVGGWQYWGFLINIVGAIVGIVLSLPIGILLALGRRSSLPAVRWVCTAYIEVVRGVPLISLLFVANNLLTLFLPGSFKPDIVIRAMVTITAFSAAYMAENVRGGLQAISKGQYEAAYAVGLNHFLTIGLIILPQALRSVIPAIVGQFISLFKDTSLFSFIAILDILAIARSIYEGNLQWRGTHFELFIFAALVFWVFCYTLSLVSRRIEKNLGVGER